MPEPFLPVISLTLAAITFLSTARTGLDLIIRDKDHVRGLIVEDLVLSSVQITLLSHQLDNWKRLWYVHEVVSGDLFVAYWGNFECSKVMEILRNVEQVSQDIKNEFLRRYGSAYAEAQNRYKNQQDLTQGERLATRQKLMNELGINYSTARRVKLAIMDAPTFQRQLATLEKLITALESLSISAFKRKHDVEYDKKATQRLGFGAILLELANRAGQEFANHIRRCKQQTLPPSHTIDFQLDLAYGVGDISREEYIVQRSKSKGFPYYVRILEGSEDSPVTIVTEESVFEQLHTRCRTLSSAPDIPNNLDQNHTGSRRSSFDRSSPTESLRVTLTNPSDSLLESDWDHFPKPERYKLMYELCETALILLATPSLSDLCICSIQRHRLSTIDTQYEHYLRVNNAHQAIEFSEGLGTCPSWCTDPDFKDMHFRRLGIVLAEISTGKLIPDVKYDRVSRRVSATPGMASEAGGHANGNIAKLVAAAAGEDLAHAVQYCLQVGAKPEQITKADLARFYNQVVAP